MRLRSDRQEGIEVPRDVDCVAERTGEVRVDRDPGFVDETVGPRLEPEYRSGPCPAAVRRPVNHYRGGEYGARGEAEPPYEVGEVCVPQRVPGYAGIRWYHHICVNGRWWQGHERASPCRPSIRRDISPDPLQGPDLEVNRTREDLRWIARVNRDCGLELRPGLIAHVNVRSDFDRHGLGRRNAR